MQFVRKNTIFVDPLLTRHVDFDSSTSILSMPKQTSRKKCDVAIHFDSQAAIESLNSYVIDSRLIWECGMEVE